MAKKNPNYQLLEKRIQDEIKELMKEVKSKVQWLDKYCMESIYASESLFDLWELVELKKRLEEIVENLGQESHIIVGMSGYQLHLLETEPGYSEEMRLEIERLANQD
jgi:hypothetical protein